MNKNEMIVYCLNKVDEVDAFQLNLGAFALVFTGIIITVISIYKTLHIEFTFNIPECISIILSTLFYLLFFLLMIKASKKRKRYLTLIRHIEENKIKTPECFLKQESCYRHIVLF